MACFAQFENGWNDESIACDSFSIDCLHRARIMGWTQRLFLLNRLAHSILVLLPYEGQVDERDEALDVVTQASRRFAQSNRLDYPLAVRYKFAQ
jgi:hypothetical protein